MSPFLVSFQKHIFLVFSFSLLFFSLTAHAECTNFSVPDKDTFIFYNCVTGDLQRIDKKNNITDIPNYGESLGSFIHIASWSPDKTKAFILSENISAAVQNLRLTTSKRDYGSLNWWLYDLKTGNATLLDKKILSIGWLSDSSAVYNWDNNEIDSASIEGLSLARYTKLFDLTKNNQNTLETLIAPFTTGEHLVFPLEKGLYIFNASKESVFVPLPEKIQKMQENPFQPSSAIIQSGNILFSFSVNDKNVLPISSNFSAISFSFLNKNTLILLETPTRLSTLDLSSKETRSFTLEGYPSIDTVLQGNEGSFIFTVTDNTYIKKISDISPISFKENEESVLLFHFEKSSSALLLKTGNTPSIEKKNDPAFHLADFLNTAPGSGEYRIELFDSSEKKQYTFFFSSPENSFSYTLPFFNNISHYKIYDAQTGTLLLDGKLDQFLSCVTTGTCPTTSPKTESLTPSQPTKNIDLETKNIPFPQNNSGSPTAPQEQKSGISSYFLVALAGIFALLFLGVFFLIRKAFKKESSSNL